MSPTGLPVAKRFQQDVVRHMELTSHGVSQMDNWLTMFKLQTSSRAQITASDIPRIVREELLEFSKDNEKGPEQTTANLRREVLSALQPVSSNQPLSQNRERRSFGYRTIDTPDLIVSHNTGPNVHEMARDADNIEAHRRVRRQYGLELPKGGL
ncbi:hypothetical protein FGB62_67g116 [Gracilaria domingensis]|nr:hypothetical protein FGB62_67g116 [Gracilaria domingensis]